MLASCLHGTIHSPPPPHIHHQSAKLDSLGNPNRLLKILLSLWGKNREMNVNECILYFQQGCCMLQYFNKLQVYRMVRLQDSLFHSPFAVAIIVEKSYYFSALITENWLCSGWAISSWGEKKIEGHLRVYSSAAAFKATSDKVAQICSEVGF